MTTFLLPVSDEQRREWVIQVPEALKNSRNDYVSFQASGPREIDEANKNCYAVLRPDYKKYEILCRPKRTENTLGAEDAGEFFRIMTELGVIPGAAELRLHDDGLYCWIPKGCAPNAQVYTTLTCYRWVDAHPGLIWLFLRLLEQDERRHPFQVLPFAINQYISNCNHSFLTVGGWVAKTKTFETAANPTLGLAARIFFDPQDERGQKDLAHDKVYVNNTIGALCRRLTPKIQQPSGSSWGPSQQDAPKYLLHRPEDSLCPELGELYRIPNITTEQIDEILGRLFTEKSK